MRSSTFSSKPSAWFKTKVFSLFSLIFFSFLLVGCGGADYSDPGKPGRAIDAKELTGFTFGSYYDIKGASFSGTDVDIAVRYDITSNDGHSTNVEPTVTIVGADYSPKGAVDFTTSSTPKTYTVTADDNTIQNYYVTIRRAFVVSDATALKNAISTVTSDIQGGVKPISYITIFVTQDIDLLAADNVVIPSSWASRNIRLENNNPGTSVVTIKNLTIENDPYTVERRRVNLDQSNQNCTVPSICNPTDFNRSIRDNLNGTFDLDDDIDLSNYTNWEPIGNSTHPFTGILNGNNHTISGLRFKNWNNDATFIGLFGNVSGGKIRDLKVVADSTSTIYLTRDLGELENQYFGILAGYAENGAKLSRITVSTSPDTTPFTIIKTGQANLFVGGVVGYLRGGDPANLALIERSASSVTFNVTNNYDGGKLYNTYVGGIAGRNYNRSKIENSYATGSITTNSKENAYTGGIVGYNWGGAIANSYANGTIWVKGGSVAFGGGIVGNNNYNGSIRYSAALNPSITVSASSTLGAWRIAGEGTFTNNIALDNMTVGGTNTNSYIGSNGDSKTLLQLQTDTTWQGLGWDFNTIWYWGGTRPLLR